MMASGGYEPIPTDETDDNERGRDNKGAENSDDDDDFWTHDLSKYDKDGNIERDPPRDPNRTQPFKPGASSTPFGDGERIALSSRTRLPKEKGPRFAETSFIEGKPQQEETFNERFAWQEVKDAFPNADKSRLKVRSITAPRAGGGGGGAVLEVAMRGKDKWYRLYTLTKGDAEKTINKSLPKEIKAGLDPWAGIKIKDAEIQQNAQQQEEVRQTIEEDQAIADDENEQPSVRERARERVVENTQRAAELGQEQNQLEQEREQLEERLPLRERVKNIFKKYGWTLQAVALAVGVVLSALALAGLNGLKAGTKAVGQGLKAIGQKLGSLLPGLIGSIVSFIFKAAGQVFSFLGEHAWLLILAVVAFFMERLLKRKRK